MEDVNELIELAHQMGLIDAQIEKYVSNATKCMTWPAVQASHTENDKTVVFELEDLFGILVLIAMGLSGALITWLAEMMIFLHRYFTKGFTKGKKSNDHKITQVTPPLKSESSRRVSFL